jgi:hypothetical protein
MGERRTAGEALEGPAGFFREDQERRGTHHAHVRRSGQKPLVHGVRTAHPLQFDLDAGIALFGQCRAEQLFFLDHHQRQIGYAELDDDPYLGSSLRSRRAR